MRHFLNHICQIGYGARRRLCNLTIALHLAVFPLSSAGLAETAGPLVALGDSLTAGYGLPDGEGLVPQLQAWLAREGVEVVVQNAGVSGDTTAGGLARVDWALGPEAAAVMVILGGNDMLRGLPVATVRANLEGILQAAKARELPVLLVGMKAPSNWGPEYKTEFDAIYPALAAQYGASYYPDYFAGLLAAGADPSDPASMARYMQEDGLHPTAEGVGLIVEGLGPVVQAFLAVKP